MFRIANGALGVFKRRPCLLAWRFQTEPPANQIGEYPTLHLPLDLRRTYTAPDSPKEYTLAGSGGVRAGSASPPAPPKRGALVQRRTFILLFLFPLYMDWWSQPGVISAASERIVALSGSSVFGIRRRTRALSTCTWEFLKIQVYFFLIPASYTVTVL